ncbi:MAG TPA: MBL fold metallo-hydrolase [Dehalococcoidia bacterium]|nr:MBL fold metallo-hydrolase [Dehalococcoidia bacterium]
MDYFVWLLGSPERTFLPDTGFKPDVSARRNRTYMRSPSEELRLAGIDPASISDIVISHLHNDPRGP